MLLFRLKYDGLLPRFLIGKRRMIKNGIELTLTKNQGEKEKLTEEDISSYNTLESDNVTIVNLSQTASTPKIRSRRASFESDDLSQLTDNDNIKILD